MRWLSTVQFDYYVKVVANLQNCCQHFGCSSAMCNWWLYPLPPLWDLTYGINRSDSSWLAQGFQKVSGLESTANLYGDPYVGYFRCKVERQFLCAFPVGGNPTTCWCLMDVFPQCISLSSPSPGLPGTEQFRGTVLLHSSHHPRSIPACTLLSPSSHHSPRLYIYKENDCYCISKRKYCWRFPQHR